MTYPTVFMAPLFTSRPNSHIGRGLTDIDGAIHFATVLEHMKYPWSINQYTDFIDGASFWRLQNLSQLLPIGYLWTATRFISPPLAISLFILIGWVIAGFVVFLICRKLDFNSNAALLIAVMVQMLPILRTNAANYTNYVWIGVPLCSIYLLIGVLEKPTGMNWLKVALSTIAIAFFDFYWFYFVLVACALCIFMLRKDIWTRLQSAGTFFKLSVTVAVISSGWAITRVFMAITGSQGEMKQSRPIAIAELGMIKTQAAKIMDYVNRPWSGLLGGERNISLPVGYIGLFIAFLAICGIVLTAKKKKLRFIALLSSIYVLLTLQPELEVFEGTLPLPSGLFRYVSPGVQYPTRAGMIGEALITVLAAVGVSEIFKRLTLSKSLKVVATWLLFAIVVIDLNPSADRVYSTEYDQYSAARKELQQDPTAVVLALPLNKFQRTWHEQWMLGVPFANSMYDKKIWITIDKQLSGGPGSFAAFLNKSGVNYLYTYDLGSFSMLRFNLREPRFKKIATMSTYGYEQGRVQMSLYKVTALPSDKSCVSCSQILKTEISGTYPSDDGMSYWASTDSAYINVTNTGPLNVWNDTSALTSLTFDVYSLNRQRIEISDSNGKVAVILEPNRGFRYTAQASSASPVRITAQLPCAKPKEIFLNSKDPRILCFNIFNVNS
jgi:hypothetical protein